MIANEKFCFLDFETNGLNYQEDQITEVGIILADSSLQVMDAVNYFVQLEPGKIIPSAIVEMTGITKRDCDGGVPLGKAKESIAKFIGKSTVVAHNAPFDLGFISDAVVPKSFFCTRTISCILFPNESHKLKDMAKLLSFPPAKAHRAITDATNVKFLFEYYRNRLGERGIEVFRNKLISMPERPWNYITPNAVIAK